MALSSFRSGLAIVGAVFLLAVAGTPAPGAEKSFDISKAVVGIKAQLPSTARTARILGTERIGSGIVTGPGGKQAPATVVAYDHDSGFGVLRIRGRLDTQPMRLGDSRKLGRDGKVLIASRGGNQPVIAANVVSRRLFTGDWEYMLESAIYTSPPIRFIPAPR